VAGELLLRAGVTMFQFVENLQPYQFAKDTYRLGPNAPYPRVADLQGRKRVFPGTAMDERIGETVGISGTKERRPELGLHRIPVSD
jgi:hypothetical protein